VRSQASSAVEGSYFSVPVWPLRLDDHANIRSMCEYRYTVTEHDPERPWIVCGTSRGTVKLDDGANFFEWAHENWPAPQWSVELDPYQLVPWLR
jgi:hypothetical protein